MDTSSQISPSDREMKGRIIIRAVRLIEQSLHRFRAVFSLGFLYQHIDGVQLRGRRRRDAPLLRRRRRQEEEVRVLRGRGRHAEQRGGGAPVRHRGGVEAVGELALAA